MPELSRNQLDEAVTKEILTPAQAEAFWSFLQSASASAESLPAPVASARFTLTNVLYYLGGMMAIGAMSLFMTLGFESFGGWGIFAIAGLYAIAALVGVRVLLHRGFQVPAGILSALAISLVPLAIYGMQHALHLWGDTRPFRDYTVFVDWRWALMEIGTLLAGALVLFFYRLPFAVMPVAVTLWYMSMDFVPLFTPNHDPDWKARRVASIVWGLVMILLALYIDTRSRRRPDFGFWIYLFGACAFWGGLSLSNSGNQLEKFLYALLNVGLIFVGVILARRVFTVFGALGTCGYLGYLAYDVFSESVMFPILLTLLGLAVVCCGIWWQKHELGLRAMFRGFLPAGLRAAVETAGGV